MLCHNIPLSLYVHIPWCVKKCPYCDFNSHALKTNQKELPEIAYVDALIKDLERDLKIGATNNTSSSTLSTNKLVSIFIGGGTPSLFSPAAINKLVTAIKNRLSFSPNIEITMEANPGTVEQRRFEGFRAAGINRLSIGCQSFNKVHLQKLGRIHDDKEAENAVIAAKKAGFDNINLDLMFGLPNQTIEETLQDLRIAINLEPTHISWYQLTLEPNTLFHHNPPALPNSDILWEMQNAGQTLLAQNNYYQYEVSAYSKMGKQCIHNRNYWEFGDYLGIGAGAHSKITTSEVSSCPANTKESIITRYLKYKNPKTYLNSDNTICEENKIAKNKIAFEFMLNALRLQQPITIGLFEERTGLSFSMIADVLQHAVTKELLIIEKDRFYPSNLGRKFLNDLIALFL